MIFAGPAVHDVKELHLLDGRKFPCVGDNFLGDNAPPIVAQGNMLVIEIDQNFMNLGLADLLEIDVWAVLVLEVDFREQS